MKLHLFILSLLLCFAATAQVDQQNGSAFTQFDLMQRVGPRDGIQLKVGGLAVIGDGGAGTWRWDANSTAEPIAGKIIQVVIGSTAVTTGRWMLVSQTQDGITGLKDSFFASGLQRTLERNNKLTKSADIDAGDSTLGISGNFTLKGKGLNTNVGIISDPDTAAIGQPTLTMNTADSLGLQYVRGSATISSTSGTIATGGFDALKTANRHFIQFNTRNYLNLDGTATFCSDAERAAYVLLLDSFIRTKVVGSKAKIGVANNEAANPDYYAIDSSRNPDGSLTETNSARRVYFNEAKPLDSLIKKYCPGVMTAESGFTGKPFYYLVWKDFIDRGVTDSAAKFAYHIWPTSERNALYAGTWDTFSNRAKTIAMERQLIELLKTSTIDYANIHFKARLNGIDSAYIDPIQVYASIAFLKRATGKPVISNEVGSKGTAPTILQQLLQYCVDVGMPYVGLYDGTSRTNNFTATSKDVSLRGTDFITLNAIGAGTKSKYTVLKNLIRDLFKAANGKLQRPSLADGITHVLGIDEQGNEITLPLNSGGGGITPLDTTINTNGLSLQISIPMSGYTATSVQTIGINGSGIQGFANSSGNVIIYYSSAPDGSVRYKIGRQ